MGLLSNALLIGAEGKRYFSYFTYGSVDHLRPLYFHMKKQTLGNYRLSSVGFNGLFKAIASFISDNGSLYTRA